MILRCESDHFCRTLVVKGRKIGVKRKRDWKAIDEMNNPGSYDFVAGSDVACFHLIKSNFCLHNIQKAAPFIVHLVHIIHPLKFNDNGNFLYGMNTSNKTCKLFPLVVNEGSYLTFKFMPRANIRQERFSLSLHSFQYSLQFANSHVIDFAKAREMNHFSL